MGRRSNEPHWSGLSGFFMVQVTGFLTLVIFKLSLLVPHLHHYHHLVPISTTSPKCAHAQQSPEGGSRPLMAQKVSWKSPIPTSFTARKTEVPEKASCSMLWLAGGGGGKCFRPLYSATQIVFLDRIQRQIREGSPAPRLI